MRDGELTLPGGNLGGAVRIGNTIRKPAGSWTPAVDALLRHLERAGFQGAPRALGVDDVGRHVVSYLEGETVGVNRPWPSWVWTDEALEQTAAWLRRYHEAVESFVPPAEARWRLPAPEGGGLVCHNDVAPYNVVWRDGLVGVIDWDLAAPGDPRWDVAQACIGFSPLLPRDLAIDDGADPSVAYERCRRFLDAYGVEDRVQYAGLVGERYERGVRRIERGAETAPEFARLLADKGAYFARMVTHLADIRDDLAAALA